MNDQAQNRRLAPNRTAWLIMAVLMLSFGLLEASTPPAAISTQSVQLIEGSISHLPQWELSDSGNQEFQLNLVLPRIDISTVEANGAIWQKISLPRDYRFQAAEQGQTGQPGLPSMSRMLAVPAGMMFEVEVLSAEKTVIDDLDILPLQDPAADDFAFDSSAYSQKTGNAKLPVVKIGSPAIIAGQPVVPLIIYPISYDAPGKKASVFTNVTLRLNLVADPDNSGKAGSYKRPLPSSFASRLSSEVLGFSSPVLRDQSEKMATLTPGYSTYLAIYPNNSGLISRIDPLLQWRRQQGYNVVEINTSDSGTSNSQIKAAIQSVYDDESIPPLEFVTIFGDAGGAFSVASFQESLSGYQGGGDHYYTMLDGTDILSDVHIARVSVRDNGQAEDVIAKILNYEKNPPMADTSWFGRACVQGDPSDSGITTIYTNQWLKGQLLANGWAQVDTTWSGNFATPMVAQVGAGVSAYGYRGFLGTSGISNGHVSSLSNGGKLPVALLPTCDSGSFVSSTTCRSEAWLRASNGGAVAAVGTATIGTHTRYNNCYFLGTWDYLLNGSDHRVGVAHTSGKLALYNGYFLAEPSRAEIWAVWNNLMGDGATDMWTGVPSTLSVVHPSSVSSGGQSFTINVESGGSPVAQAQVGLYRQSDGFQLSGTTDGNGRIVFNIPALAAGSVTVTVSKHNHLPYQGGFTPGQADIFCAATSRVIDGDGIFNPGETVMVTPSLTNHGTLDAFGVTSEVTVLSGPATISSGSLSYGTISSGSEVSASTAATVIVDSDAADGSIIRLTIAATNGTETWNSLLEETVLAAAFSVSDLGLADFGGSVDPGESGNLDITLANNGSLDANAVSATLSSSSDWISISDNLADFGNLASGSSHSATSSPFNITASPDCFGGHLATFELAITYSSGKEATYSFALTVGSSASDQPTGPDSYGYYAFDNTDTSVDAAPTYEWVGIDPDHGGQGADLGLTDFGWEQDDTKTLSLPFDFGFYGDSYNQISICSNGWLAMGETPVNFYRNFPLPAPHSAGALIAPFWDNLNQTGNKKVYTWYDEANHRFIVQWYDMPNHYSGAVSNFEVILLDPQYHPTITGDGMILFQYEKVGNTDNRDGYATVGIQNMERTVGLTYSYWNQGAPGAASLEPGRAILYAPMAHVARPNLSVTPGSITTSMAPDTETTEYLHLTNNGEDESVLNFNIAKFDPAAMEAGKSAGHGQTEVEARNISGSLMTTTITEYTAGSSLTIPLHVVCQSPDDEWIVQISLDAPNGVSVSSATAFTTNQGTMDWSGQTGNGVVTSWAGQGMESGFITNGQSADASITLDFDASLTGDMTLEFTLMGDNFGGNPHQVTGQIVLAASGPTISISEPSGGDYSEIGSTLDVQFLASEVDQVNIDLQRIADGTWESLAENISGDLTSWTWNVVGEPGPYARIRISDTSDPSVFDISGIFAIGRNLDWLQLAASGGSIDAGETLDLAVVLNSAGLSNGLHVANIVISGNGGAPVTVPVSLNVSDVSAVGDLPGSVVLNGNYPNPFNPSTTISFSLPTDQDICLRVYTTRGRLVNTLIEGPQLAGRHHALWNGRNSQGRSVASGVYFYRLETGNGNFTGKMVLTK